ncbi:hypothetical protein [Micromonospora sp. NPDC093244]|uniref:hypothetical protein n=1 Tax=Micromonospora sp. NPDC093244 TaxID=3155071 RepID=UPI003413B068
MATTLVVGATLGAAAAVVNSVPLLLGEGGRARADRSAWSQTAEFASLILDSGWAWAAMAVAVGWLVSGGLRPVVGVLAGALAGCVALIDATIVYDAVPMLFPFHQGFAWGQTPFWLVASLVLGLPLGAVGATIRRPGLIGVLAALVAPIGAALNMVVLPPPAESPVAEPVVLTVWAAAAAATVLVLVFAVCARRPGDRNSGTVRSIRPLRTDSGSHAWEPPGRTGPDGAGPIELPSRRPHSGGALSDAEGAAENNWGLTGNLGRIHCRARSKKAVSD